MGSLSIQDLAKGDEAQQFTPSEYPPDSESPMELYPKAPSLPSQHAYPHLHPLHPQQKKGRPVELDRRSLPFHIRDPGISQARKTWASSVDLAYIDPEALRFGALEDARRGSSAISSLSVGRLKTPALASRDSHFPEFGGLKGRKPHHHSALSVGSGVTGAYDRIKEKQRKLQALRQAVDGESTPPPPDGKCAAKMGAADFLFYFFSPPGVAWSRFFFYFSSHRIHRSCANTFRQKCVVILKLLNKAVKTRPAFIPQLFESKDLKHLY